VAVTDDEAVTVEVEVFDRLEVLVFVTVADGVLDTIELLVVVTLLPALLVIRGLPEELAVGVLVFDGAEERDGVVEAVFVFEARDAEKVGVVVDVFELDTDFV